MHVQPYLYFEGTTDEALAFYKKTLGAEVTVMMRFGENPEADKNPPGSDGKVMHCNFNIGKTQIMASDGMCQGEAKRNFDGFALTLGVKDAAEAKQKFEALLTDGGQVTMPLGKTFFAESFGMLKDRFGVHWIVITDPAN